MFVKHWCKSSIELRDLQTLVQLCTPGVINTGFCVKNEICYLSNNKNRMQICLPRGVKYYGYATLVRAMGSSKFFSNLQRNYNLYICPTGIKKSDSSVQLSGKSANKFQPVRLYFIYIEIFGKSFSVVGNFYF